MALKVLVVDDSALMRKHLTALFEGAGFEVALARTGAEAVEQVTVWHPDVVTLDINMPTMDGLTALSLIMAARPTPTVMISSLTRAGALATLEALAMGAFDFVTKPGGTISLSLEEVSAEILAKVKAASKARLKGARPQAVRSAPAPPKPAPPRAAASGKLEAREFGLVLIGVSTGGPRTLEEILPLLPADFPWPVLVAQHMPASFTGPFAARMDSLCALEVREAGNLDELKPGCIYIGRGGTDLVIGERAGRPVAISKPESAKHLWHPSVDLLVASAVEHVPPRRLVGVQLTGMGYDGAAAMAELKQRGGRTIAESEESAVVFGMPKELIERGGATLVLSAGKIAAQLRAWLS